MRIRVAEKTTKQPATVSAAWASISTQSMLRLGSAGLERMLPSPESGLRCSIDRPIGLVDRPDRAGVACCGMQLASTRGQRLGRRPRIVMSSGSEIATGSSGMMPDSARNMHLTTGAAPRRAEAGLLEVRHDGVRLLGVDAEGGERRRVVPRVAAGTPAPCPVLPATWMALGRVVGEQLLGRRRAAVGARAGDVAAQAVDDRLRGARASIGICRALRARSPGHDLGLRRGRRSPGSPSGVSGA